MAQRLGLGAAILGLELLCQSLELLDGAGNAPPGAGGPGRVTFPVNTEVGVLLALDQKVATFVTVGAPRLDCPWLIQILLVAVLLVRLVDQGFDGFGRGHGPENESVEQGELFTRSAASHRGVASRARTLSVGAMELKVVLPESGFLESQADGHWDLWDAMASSNALP